MEMFKEVLNFKNKNESGATPLILNDYDKTALEKNFFETSVIFFK